MSGCTVIPLSYVKIPGGTDNPTGSRPSRAGFGQPSFGVVEVFDICRTCGPPQLLQKLVAEDHWLVGHNRSIYSFNSTGGRSLDDFISQERRFHLQVQVLSVLPLFGNIGENLSDVTCLTAQSHGCPFVLPSILCSICIFT